VEAVFARLSALSDPAELLSVAAPLGATGFRWAVDLIEYISFSAFDGMAVVLHRAAESCGAAQTVRASCDFAAAVLRVTQFQLALPLLEGALEVRNRVLGAASREALDVRHALGLCTYHHGAYAEAEPHFKAAYDGRKRLLGARDSATLHSLCNLAMTLHGQGKAAACGALMGVALPGLEAALGPLHPHTLTSVYSLANIAFMRKDYAAAAPLFRRALEGCVAGPLGEEHGLAVLSRDQLTDCLVGLDRPSDAEPLFRRAAELCTRSHGAADERALVAQARLAGCLARQGRHAESLELARATLRAASGRGEAPKIAMSLSVLEVDALTALGRVGEALSLAQREQPRMLARLGPDHVLTVALSTMLNRLTDGTAYGSGYCPRR
jgi:tetratricopeptide (TPR) repeat protein